MEPHGEEIEEEEQEEMEEMEEEEKEEEKEKEKNVSSPPPLALPVDVCKSTRAASMLLYSVA
eukprot:9526404-Ditylum_brightwellii.AAC.1